MIGLQKPYVNVQRGLERSYGGSQMWSERETIRRCGCGPVAAMDLLLYLENRTSPIASADYERELQAITKKYFFLIRPFGINGISFVFGLNRLLRDRGLPYRAAWETSRKQLWPRIEEMLGRDLPVILSVGPNFPRTWAGDQVDFYVRLKNGGYRPATKTKSHYVTATGIDETWLRISSWGREYYILRKDYDDYARYSSIPLLTNIVYLKIV